ncbi:hypothetical protein P9386_15325 [Caldifermentibacillus hisashii]|uniref:hypothetical protein n=1 Tax=Caldifermentibacillus hisashii TaxID=996558 RepID=UPI002E1FED5D|nr:hypothetical protein [Caldifermentibacillus hisashii]
MVYLFTHRNDDENVSSPKKWVLRPKATTIRGFVAKKVGSPSKSDDDKGCRRQKVEISVQKRRRERVSSPKSGDFRTKTTTRTSFVAKK